MKRINFNIKDRKILYGVLSIVLVCVFTLSIAYAALNAVLTISGNAEVASSTWDVHLENAKVSSGSISNVTPILTNTTATFSANLSTPGEYYQFTVDVVNDGSIDAMIESVNKTPELTEIQAKYLNYTVEYENGESIINRQLVESGSFVRLKVRVEYRNDIIASDLPTVSDTIELSFTVNYVQSDDNESNLSLNNNAKLIKIVSGSVDAPGSEICIGDECFYVISSNDTSVTMLAKYNLLVGNSFDGNAENIVYPLENPTGIQDARAKGVQFDADWNTINFPYYGTTFFSTDVYWFKDGAFVENYPKGYSPDTWLPSYYVYNSNSIQYQYVQNYKNYLSDFDINILDARLIKIDELMNLGCRFATENINCLSAPSWVYSTSYWFGNAYRDGAQCMFSNGYMVSITGDLGDFLGCRPVIEISKDNFGA